MKHNIDWNLLHKYLAGECEEKEKKHVEAWSEADPKNREFLDEIKSIWDVTPQNAVEVDARKAWQEFKEHQISTPRERIKEGVEQEPLKRPYGLNYWTGKRHNLRSIWYAGAAAAMILLAVLFYHQIPQFFEQADKQFKTERTQQMRVNLADGSQITLNAESKLTVPSGFPEESREVYLEGEGYFDVKSDKGKPFIVKSDHAFIKVMGTKFSVRAYDNAEKSLAVVEEGKVMVNYRNQRTKHQQILRANDLAILSHQETTRPEVVQVKELEEYLGWRKGKLVFHNTPVREVERRLERWYGIQLQIADSTLYDKNLTAVFEDEPLIEVLNVVALSLGAEYKRDGQRIIFS